MADGPSMLLMTRMTSWHLGKIRGSTSFIFFDLMARFGRYRWVTNISLTNAGLLSIVGRSMRRVLFQ